MEYNSIVVVEWGDAFIDTDDFKPAKAASTKPVYRKTVGWFIAENEEGIVLATDIYDKKSDGAAAMMFIPWGMVTGWYDVGNNSR